MENIFIRSKGLTFILLLLLFKFWQMRNEKDITSTKKHKIMK